MFFYLLRAIPGPAGLPTPCLETQLSLEELAGHWDTVSLWGEGAFCWWLSCISKEGNFRHEFLFSTWHESPQTINPFHWLRLPTQLNHFLDNQKRQPSLKVSTSLWFHSCRMSAMQCLKHEWLNNLPAKASKSKVRLKSQLLLQKYLAQRKWKVPVFFLGKAAFVFLMCPLKEA